MVSHIADHAESQSVPERFHVLRMTSSDGIDVELLVVHRFMDVAFVGESY
jgi:hypothetical protein